MVAIPIAASRMLSEQGMCAISLEVLSNRNPGLLHQRAFSPEGFSLQHCSKAAIPGESPSVKDPLLDM